MLKKPVEEVLGPVLIWTRAGTVIILAACFTLRMVCLRFRFHFQEVANCKQYAERKERKAERQRNQVEANQKWQRGKLKQFYIDLQQR